MAAAERPVSPEHLRLVADTPHAGYLILHLRDYAAWKVSVNGETLPWARPIMLSSPSRRRPDGCARSSGPRAADVDWTTTGDVVMGRLLSLMSLGYSRSCS